MGSSGGPPAPAAPPLPVTDGAVDLLGLADSQFVTGRYDLAAETYERLLEVEKHPGPKGWLHHQLGGCYRNLGRVADAEHHYRMVAGRHDLPVLAENSRWWLKVLRERQSFDDRLARLRSALKAQQETDP